METITDTYLSELAGLQRPKLGKREKLELIS